MSWRIVLITSLCKLSYRNEYLVIRGEKTTLIHLSEINTIIVENTAANITSYLLSELMKHKVKIVFCDERRNPQGELVPYYGSHNSSKKIREQINWSERSKKLIWTRIIYCKIMNQIDLLKKYNLKTWSKLFGYLDELTLFDETNREGHAAKVYFNSLFGTGFARDKDNDINAALNYGYAILLSAFNKEIVASGYITQLGMKHKNEFNPFNLTSDIMEPFRVLIDEVVFLNKDEKFDSQSKTALINILNRKVVIDNKEQHLTNAISIYVRSIFNAISAEDVNEIKYFDFV